MTGPSLREKQKAETRKKILLSAGRLFTEVGYENTTMRKIAAEVGISPGAIFVHFSGKSELLVETMVDLIDDQLAIARTSFPTGGTLKQKMMHVPSHMYSFYSADTRLIRELLSRTLFMPPEKSEKADQQGRMFVGHIANICEEAKQSGKLRLSTNSILFATTYFSIYLLVLLELIKQENPEPKQAIIYFEALLDQLLDGS